jgi:two-component system, NtrC family, sensor histidine kinase HydH
VTNKGGENDEIRGGTNVVSFMQKRWYVKFPLTVRPKYLILISLTLAVILFLVTILDITEGRKDINQSKTDEAYSLLRTVQKSAENVFISNTEVENLIKEKLVDAAYFIAEKEMNGKINSANLGKIAGEIGIEHIAFYSADGKPDIANDNIKFNIKKDFKPELDSVNAGVYDYFFPGLLYDQDGAEHFSVVQKRYSPGKGYLIISISSGELLEFRKKIGIGSLFQNIAGTEEIIYLVIQDENGIITASHGIDELSSIEGDVFLAASLENQKFASRETDYRGKKIFEAVNPFFVNGEPTGIIRIGLSLEQADNLVNRTILRSIVISSLLLLTGIVLLIVITDKQNLALIKDENRKIQTYTGNILNNMSEGVLAADKNGKINLMNPMAEKILGLLPGEAIGLYCSEIINNSDCIIERAIKLNAGVEYSETLIRTKKGKEIILGGTADIVRNEDGTINTVVAVIRDVTLQRSIEESQQRNEKLSAMGELAAGVAHEIKNPLNAIGITVQRFEKEYLPAEGEEEYRDMIKMMKSEVERVSSIINQFLTYSRPRKVKLLSVQSDELLKDVYNTFYSRSVKDNVNLDLNTVDAGINADYSLLKQALINIVQNAFEAVSAGGTIKIESVKEDSKLAVIITDNGAGIPAENLGKIFNLYFTTKQAGSGLGLSIVNQIITDHNGSIKIESLPGEGTKFIVSIPLIKDLL